MSLALIQYLTDEDLEKISSNDGLLDATRKAAMDELIIRQSLKKEQNDV